MKFSVKLNAWMAVFILLPLFLLLSAGIALRYRQLLHDEEVGFVRLLNNLERPFIQQLRGQGDRIKTVAALPATERLLSISDRTTRGVNLKQIGRLKEINANWTTLDRNNMVVKEVMDNSLAESLRQLCQQDPLLDSLILTDSTGRLLAASEKTKKYSFEEEDWWILASSEREKMLVGESEDGIFITYNLTARTSNQVLTGVVRAVLDVDELIKRIPNRAGDAPYIVQALQGDRIRILHGSATPEDLNWFASTGLTEGYVNHWRFRSRLMDGGLSWMRPIQLVVLYHEDAIPARILRPMLSSLGLSLLLIIAVAFVASRSARQILVQPYAERMEAGEWIMHRAFPDKERQREHPLPHAPKPGPDATPVTAVQHKLNDWFEVDRKAMQRTFTGQVEDMRRDLNMAREFQMAYLNRPYPKVPSVHVEGRLRLAFNHYYEPALALGGDFFDILNMPPDTAGIFLADVMGHGTRSALITSIVRTLIADLKNQGRNATHFITELNKQFCEMLKSFPQPLFASAYYFVMDTTSRMATYSTAGHPDPFHIRRSIGRVERLEVPKPRGSALGLIPDETFTGGHCRLIAGDIFIFYTDGFVEAHNRQGQEFGLARMEAVITRKMYRPGREIIDSLMEAVRKHTQNEPLDDDICLVAVEVTTESENTTSVALA